VEHVTTRQPTKSIRGGFAFNARHFLKADCARILRILLNKSCAHGSFVSLSGDYDSLWVHPAGSIILRESRQSFFHSLRLAKKCSSAFFLTNRLAPVRLGLRVGWVRGGLHDQYPAWLRICLGENHEAMKLEDLSSDLLIWSLAFLQVKDVASFAANSAFRAVAESDPVWEVLCAAFWATKHPMFHLTPTRRKALLEEEDGALENTGRSTATAATPAPARKTWRQRYKQSIKDGKRTHLTGPKELSSLVFDFRFRARPEHSVR
jgi:hypothetical protein